MNLDTTYISNKTLVVCATFVELLSGKPKWGRRNRAWENGVLGVHIFVRTLRPGKQVRGLKNCITNLKRKTQFSIKNVDILHHFLSKTSTF